MQLPPLNIIDLAILAVLGLSIVRGFTNGGLREMLGVVGLVAPLAIAFLLTPTLRPLMPEIGLFGDFADACLIATFLAFISMFILSSVGFSMLLPLASRSAGGLCSGNRIFGLAFGALRGAVIVLALYAGYDLFVAKGQESDLFSSAAFASPLKQALAWGRDDLANLPGFIGGRIEAMTTGCGYLDQPSLPTLAVPTEGAPPYGPADLPAAAAHSEGPPY